MPHLPSRCADRNEFLPGELGVRSGAGLPATTLPAHPIFLYKPTIIGLRILANILSFLLSHGVGLASGATTGANFCPDVLVFLHQLTCGYVVYAKANRGIF